MPARPEPRRTSARAPEFPRAPLIAAKRSKIAKPAIAEKRWRYLLLVSSRAEGKPGGMRFAYRKQSIKMWGCHKRHIGERDQDAAATTLTRHFNAGANGRSHARWRIRIYATTEKPHEQQVAMGSVRRADDRNPFTAKSLASVPGRRVRSPYNHQ
ncbi:MAG: hypothetical protein R3C40_03370 [Parvularculaceae bacterium]